MILRSVIGDRRYAAGTKTLMSNISKNHVCGFRLLMAAAVSFAAAGPLPAEVISQWNFNNTANGGSTPGGPSNYGPSPFAASSKSTNVAVGGLRRGTGVSTSGGTGAVSGWGGVGWDGPTDLASAITAGDFVTFTVKANAGFELSLSDIAAYNIRRSNLGPTTGQWQFSTDGSSFTTIGSPITWGSTTNSSGNSQSALSLSGFAALQNVPDTTTVTFRLANWSASGAAGTWYFNGAGSTTAEQSLTVNGVVAVPEPPAFVLVAAGLGTLTYLARGRRGGPRSTRQDPPAAG